MTTPKLKEKYGAVLLITGQHGDELNTREQHELPVGSGSIAVFIAHAWKEARFEHRDEGRGALIAALRKFAGTEIAQQVETLTDTGFISDVLPVLVEIRRSRL